MLSADILHCATLAEWLTATANLWLQADPNRSIRQLAALLGIPHSTLYDAMRGARKLPPRWADVLIMRAELDPFEADVLRGMIEVEQAGTPAQLERARDALRGKQRLLAARGLRRQDAVWLVNPLTASMRELARTTGWRPDPAWISAQLGITEEEASTALAVHTALDPSLQDAHVTVSTGHHPVEQPVPDWHRQVIELALRASQLPREQRHFESWLAAIPFSRLPRLKARVMAFIEEISAICEEDDGQPRDVVVAVSAQLFPMSRMPDGSAPTFTADPVVLKASSLRASGRAAAEAAPEQPSTPADPPPQDSLRDGPTQKS